MDFKKIFTPKKLNKWVGKQILSESDDILYYRLEINRSFWFKQNYQNNIIFSGRTREIIFVKIFDYCYSNLKWKDTGRKVRLYDYPRKYEVSKELKKSINQNPEDKENIVIEDMIEDNMHMLGLIDGIDCLDCCFRVEQMYIR